MGHYFAEIFNWLRSFSFFEKSAVWYHNILEEFISELHPEELHNGCFQQDGATAHTAQMPLN
jgi:hypothetical protein